MTPEQQRIAIAEACGWKQCGQSLAGLGGIPPKNSKRLPYPEYHSEHWRLEPWRGLPDYPNDLNAMHEAEKFAYTNQPSGWLIKYEEALAEECSRAQYPSYLPICATASQRSRAFIKVMGKWID